MGAIRNKRVINMVIRMAKTSTGRRHIIKLVEAPVNGPANLMTSSSITNNTNTIHATEAKAKRQMVSPIQGKIAENVGAESSIGHNNWI